MDDDQDKAEKLAAARKKYEELKKKKTSKKGGAGKVPTAQKPKSQSEKEEQVDNNVDVEILESSESSEIKQVVQDEPSSTEVVVPPPNASNIKSDKPRSIDVIPSDVIRDDLPSPSSATRASGIPASTSYRRPSLVSGDSQTVTDVYRRQATTIGDLTADKERLEKALRESTEKLRKLDELHSTCSEQAIESQALQAQLDGAKSVSEASSVKLMELEEKEEKMASEISSLTRLNAHLSSQVSEKEMIIKEMNKKTTDDNRVDTITSNKANDERIEAMSMEISSLRALQEVTKDEADATKRELQIAKDRESKSLAQIAEFSRKITELDTASKRATERLVSESALKTSSEVRIRELEKSLNTANSEKQKLEASITDIKDKYRNLEAEFQGSNNKLLEHQKRATTLQRENAELLGRVTQLKENLNEVIKENNNLKETLSHKNRLMMSQQDTDDLDDLENLQNAKLEARESSLQGIGSTSQEPQNFSDIDLGRYHANNIGSEGENMAEKLRLREEDKRKELLSWAGYRLDLTQLANGLGRPREIYGEIFEI